MNELVLSLFPGIGMLDSAFEAEGYYVARGPDPIWGGDIRTNHPPGGVFAGVIGGPPCQTFSALSRLVRANGHEPRFGNLIPEFERCVGEALPAWFLMENVPQAPDAIVPGYGVKSFMLDNSALAGDDGWGQEQRRIRKFCFGLRGRDDVPDLRRWIDLAVFLLPDAERTVAQWQVNNDKERKTRKNAVLGPSSQNPGCTGTTKAAKARLLVASGHGTAGHEQPQGLTDRKRRKAVSASNGGCGAGKDGRHTEGAGNNGKGRYRLADALRLQGLPEDFLKDSPFTAEGKLKAVANGVPIMMGRAIARAVREATACPP